MHIFYINHLLLHCLIVITRVAKETFTTQSIAPTVQIMFFLVMLTEILQGGKTKTTLSPHNLLLIAFRKLSTIGKHHHVILCAEEPIHASIFWRFEPLCNHRSTSFWSFSAGITASPIHLISTCTKTIKYLYMINQTSTAILAVSSKKITDNTH